MEASTLVFFLKESLIYVLIYLPPLSLENSSVSHEYLHTRTHMHTYLFSFKFIPHFHIVKSLVNSVVQISSLLLPHQKTNWSTPPLPTKTYLFYPTVLQILTTLVFQDYQSQCWEMAILYSQGRDGGQHLHTIRCKGKPTLCIISGIHWLLWNQSELLSLCQQIQDSKILTKT